ncbi:transmembrane protein 134 isoform X2 [Lethenteron reissneri]|uniref:transmembrane protein 134 isoform X2 n=1 Tax=Lethenteron reissneri TaxID=7753 RepID=UPI002AB797AD|nr:transmembrane protein 134 isoform X2 [Lethenteron reissneri]
MAEQPGSFTIDDAFEISLEEKESTTPRFGSLKFERKVNLSRTSGQAAGADDVGPRESGHKYRNLEDDEDEVRTNGAMPGDLRIRPPSRQGSELSFSTVSNTTQLSYRSCLSWTRHPLILKNRKVVIASFVFLIVGIVVSSAIFFVPGFLLFIPGVYHVIFIVCAVKGKKGFRFFNLPYFEK